jgi:uncharacterized protein RhaS with RHS repeats
MEPERARSDNRSKDVAPPDAMDHSQQPAPSRRLVHYDAVRRRLWIRGQRCHHGATGAILTGVATAAMVASILQPRRALTLAATGSLLMAHDWKDLPLWFERGPQV